jgi:hypothetical protein
MALFQKGKVWADAHLFNGTYYCQLIDLKDRSILETFNAAGEYWDAEHGEIKYQIGQGCHIDQVLAQWHANLYGLGEIFDPVQTKKALASIFKYNFKDPIRDFPNPCRVYCLNDESGLVVCEWPEKVARPSIPLTYSQETLHGFEYAAAGHMIQRGLIREGMSVLKAVRERYDGEKRNPFNEFEAGSNYARSMASYALLNAFSGFVFDMPRLMVGFKPVKTENGSFRCFWSLASGWGEFIMSSGRFKLRVLYGGLKLKTLKLPLKAKMKKCSVTIDGKRKAFKSDGDSIVLADAIEIGKGQALHIRFY